MHVMRATVSFELPLLCKAWQFHCLKRQREKERDSCWGCEGGGRSSGALANNLVELPFMELGYQASRVFCPFQPK